MSGNDSISGGSIGYNTTLASSQYDQAQRDVSIRVNGLGNTIDSGDDCVAQRRGTKGSGHYSVREAERRGFSRIITSVRDDEEGISLRAAGWVCEGAAGGRGWHSARRSRSNRNAWITKQ